MRVVVRCPAKVNRFLSVGEPEPSGYHPIRTIFQGISLSDTLTIREAAEESICCDWDGLPTNNTLTKTLRLTREFTDIPPLHVELEKRIPAESGLGGGSSDAAGLLRALTQLTSGRLSERDSLDIASAVGKDVPFFLSGGLARGTGYGERIEPMPDRDAEHLVIVRPDIGVSTPQAYAALDASPRQWRDFPIGDEPYNDFERVAPCECLELLDRFRSLEASEALLCGSGSAVYGLYATEGAAQVVANRMRSEGYDRVWVARTLTREESLWMSWS